MTCKRYKNINSICCLRLYCTVPHWLSAFMLYTCYTSSLKYGQGLPYKLDSMLEIYKATPCHGHAGSSPISPTIAIGSADSLINEFLSSFCRWQQNRKAIASDYHFSISLNHSYFYFIFFHPFRRHLPLAVVSCLMWWLYSSHAMCPLLVGETHTYFIENYNVTENLNAFRRKTSLCAPWRIRVT